MTGSFDLNSAIGEANRCLLCHDAPCSKNCPAQTDPATFIRKLRFKNIKGAIRTIKQNNILGGACGMLCPTSRLCEEGCIAAGLDRPIQIGKVQKFLIEHGRDIGFKAFKKNSLKKSRIAVIGSGPAGLSCATELAKNGFGVTVFEKKKKIGGVLRYGIPPYRLDRKFLDHELKEIENLGVEFKCSHPIEKKGQIEGLLKNGFKAVFISTGLWKPISLAEKSRAKGLFSSIDFLMDVCKNGTNEHVKGKTVGVIGGGSVAIDCAVSALKSGASDVYLIYRRSYSQMPAEDDEKISAQNDGVHFLLLNQPKNYVVKNGKIKGVHLIRTVLGKKDKSGRRSPVEVKGSQWILDLDVVIEAIGNIPTMDENKSYPKVKVDRDGLIVVNEKTGKTNVKGIYAGGDIVRGPSLVVWAVQDGKIAARKIMEEL